MENNSILQLELEVYGLLNCKFCNQAKPVDLMFGKSKCKACQKAYLKNYFETKYKPIANRKLREKKDRDPNFKLQTNTRSVIRHALSYGQNYTLKRIIGLDLEGLRLYFTPLFEDGLTWEDKKAWTIDHHIPLTYFNILDPEQFKIANHWKNLRPARFLKNRIKADTVPDDAESLIADIKLCLASQ